MEVADHCTKEASALLHSALATPGTLRDKLLVLAASYAEGTYNSQLSNQIYYAIRHLDDDQGAEVSHAYVRGLIQSAVDRLARDVVDLFLRGAGPE